MIKAPTQDARPKAISIHPKSLCFTSLLYLGQHGKANRTCVRMNGAPGGQWSGASMLWRYALPHGLHRGITMPPVL